VITHIQRQPGSAFKAFLYAAALKEGIVHPGDWLSNEPIVEVDPSTGKVWAPKNNTGDRIGGRISLTEAFASSYNLPAIHTIQQLHAETLVSYAKDVFGFHSDLPRYDSLALGTGVVSPLEMAEGYSVFMLKGDRVRPYPIEKVVGPDGSVLKEYQPTRFTAVLDTAVCQEMDDLLQEVVLHGTGRMASDIPDARGKTGTTQNATDAWFCGYSDGILGIAWVGNTDYKTGLPGHMSGSVFGGTVSAGMWRDVLAAAHDLKLAVPLPEVKPAPQTQTVASVAAANAGMMVPPVQQDNGQVPQALPVNVPPRSVPAPTQSGPPSPRPDATKPAPTQTSTNSSRTSQQDDDSDYVEVQVCADTGMRASIYCPETVTRRFKRGTEPKQICRLHTGG
jgi:penicillin-binding protein 1A